MKIHQNTYTVSVDVLATAAAFSRCRNVNKTIK